MILRLRDFPGCFLLGVSLLCACNPAHEVRERELAVGVMSASSCEDARSKIFSSYLQAAQAGELSVATFRKSLARTISPKTTQSKPAEQRAYLDGAVELHATFVGFLAARRGSFGEGEDEPTLHLIRAEMRSELEPDYKIVNDKIDALLPRLREAAKKNGLPCEALPLAELARSPGPSDQHLAALRTMATAYQSCHVLDLPPLTNEAPIVEGVVKSISIDGIGWGRAYTDVERLKATHYYHRAQTAYESPCRNQNAQPLVYDYGGVPALGAKNESLNLFVNRGGGPALGIDCSAFVSTALASAGSLYRKGTTNRAIYTRFVSRDFIDPRKSGWTCFDPVTTESSAMLRPGDIGAVKGHVVMVDQVGADPLGLDRIREPSACDALTHRDFDFSIIQSSASQKHMGINRYVARDYMEGSKEIARLFEAYAHLACRSKFDHVPRELHSGEYGLIRHKDDELCRAPRVPLANEECVERCSALME